MKTNPTLLLSLFAAVSGLALPAGSRAQSAGTPTVLHSFANTDGADSVAPLIQATDGNYYGTTSGGGANSDGTVFKITAAGVLTTLHSFALSDGGFPYAPLVQGNDGNLYGTTIGGGASSDGTVFKITLPGGAFSVLHSFNSIDGNAPYAGLVNGADGALYGSCFYGGESDVGSIYKITTDGVLTVLHSFGRDEGTNPPSRLILATDGNFYGVTQYGGSNASLGSVFKISAAGTLTTLVNFSASTDPATPVGSLVEGTDGNFYGTSISGGADGDGTVFKISASGALTVLYSFTGSPDGTQPYAGLVQASDGNFYGTTSMGGDLSAELTYGTIFRITPTGSLTTLHSFALSEGSGSSATLLKGSDGKYYGTTETGGSTGTGAGTVYTVNLLDVPGTIDFATTSVGVHESAGQIALTIQRTDGGSGAVSVVAATADGTAKNGTDYTATSTTVSWEDGDTSDKTLTIDILDPKVFDGSTKTFTVTLSDPTGGAVLGSTVTSTVSILDNDTPPQPTIEITSPQADVTVVTDAFVTIAVSVTDPGGLLAKVDFFLNDALYATTKSSGPFALRAQAPAPGTYVIKAVATDTQGRTNTSVRTITVVAPSTTDPTPTADLFGGLGGHTLAGGDTIPLVASADSLSLDGTPLAEVDFYADNDLIAAFDGSGNPIPSARNHPGGQRPAAASVPRRRLAAAGDPVKASSIFTTAWGVPNLDKLVNLLVVAKTAGGRSQVSGAVTVTTVATGPGTNHAPVAAITGLVPGQIVAAGATVSVPATVSDPDNSSALPFRDGRRANSIRRNATGDPGAIIQKVEFFLNQLKAGTATAPPYSAPITPPAAGTYVVEAIVTDDAGLSGVAAPVTIQAVATPTVTLMLPPSAGTGNKTTLLEGSPVLKVRVVRTGGDVSQPLTVTYKAKGGNVSGVDYKPFKGSVTIPAGATSAKIKVKVFDDGVADGNKTLKLRLTPSTDASYAIGTPAQLKIRVLDLQSIQ